MTNNGPWRDWIPGVLSRRQVAVLCDKGCLTDTEEDRKIGHSSMDLHLTDDGYELPEGSIKPLGPSYLHFVKKHGLATRCRSTDSTYILKPRHTYLFKIRERLSNGLADARIYGQATAKSSIGRLDVLARLVVDGAAGYEGFSPEDLHKSNGEMFLEITPMTFPVRAKAGARLSQLRLFFGDPRNCEVRGPELWNTLLFDPDRGDCEKEPDDSLSVDLTECEIGGLSVAAFQAIPGDEQTHPVPLWTDSASTRPNPCRYWCFRNANENRRITIEKGRFYILRSRQRLRLPCGVAAYCRAIDETLGEMRIHYAGFVHPFFGWKRDDNKRGTPLIFEVRGHDLNVSLHHREKLARLTFYRMSEAAEENESDKTNDANYNNQELRLSGLFEEWPKPLKCGDGDTVCAAS